MDFDEISPAAFIAGLVGGLIGFVMVQRMGVGDFEVALIWRILTPVVTAIGGFVIIQGMASN